MPATPQTILITGGTGTFATAAIPIFLDAYPDATIRLLSRSEFTQVTLRRQFDNPRLQWMIGDVRDAWRMQDACKGVDTIIHAAALKHVDIGEVQGDEVVKTNIDGTRTTIRAALAQQVNQMLLLSSDKATAPVNLYGASKMVAERLMLQANMIGETRFNVVRYGNVFGSRGSVLGVFLRAIAHQRPLPITDRSMTRFFLEAPAAVALVQRLIESPYRGITVVPHLQATSLGDLIQALTMIYGGETLPMTAPMGLRPGEKWHEEMLTPEECRRTYCWDGDSKAYVLPSWPGMPSCFAFHTRATFARYTSDTWLTRLSQQTLIEWILRYGQYDFPRKRENLMSYA